MQGQFARIVSIEMIEAVGAENYGAFISSLERLHKPEQFAGLGAGLAIAKNIVERHGARIWAEAAPGEGATFSFTLGILSQAATAPPGR